MLILNEEKRTHAIILYWRRLLHRNRDCGMDILLVKANTQMSTFDCKQLFLKQSKNHKVENSTTIKGHEPRTPLIHAEYSSHRACVCDTFQFIIWETGSNSIDILCVKVNTWNANRGQHHPFSIVKSWSWNSWNFYEIENSTLMYGWHILAKSESQLGHG